LCFHISNIPYFVSSIFCFLQSLFDIFLAHIKWARCDAKPTDTWADNILDPTCLRWSLFGLMRVGPENLRNLYLCFFLSDIFENKLIKSLFIKCIFKKSKNINIFLILKGLEEFWSLNLIRHEADEFCCKYLFLDFAESVVTWN
jgi:hypothetical protein